MQTWFILGTDTDCGKTYVTGQLVDILKEAAQRVLAIKPLASGCVWKEGVLISEDAIHLNQHNDLSPDERLFLRLESPISPHLAAEKDRVTLSVNAIMETCKPFFSQHLDYLLIEGAGGLMVPLNDHETWVDFLKQTQIPVLLIVGMRLGCINHALLTEAVLRFHQIECIGWIANCIDPNMIALEENIDTLTSKLSFPLLATIPHAPR